MKKHIKKVNVRTDEIEDKLNRPNVRLHNEEDVYGVLLVLLVFICLFLLSLM